MLSHRDPALVVELGRKREALVRSARLLMADTTDLGGLDGLEHAGRSGQTGDEELSAAPFAIGQQGNEPEGQEGQGDDPVAKRG